MNCGASGNGDLDPWAGHPAEKSAPPRVRDLHQGILEEQATHGGLNAASANCCLLVAAVAGLAEESWSAFLLALAILVGPDTYCGDIRATRRHR